MVGLELCILLYSNELIMKDNYNDLINKYSQKYSEHYKVRIDPVVVRAIIQTESSGNPWAVRFEPRFLKWLRGRIKTLSSSTTTAETEYHLRSTSFGLGQLMGQTARELGFDGPYLTQLCEPELNIKYTVKYYGRLLRRYRGEVEWAISAYNLGSARKTSAGRFVNQVYVNKVLHHKNKILLAKK